MTVRRYLAAEGWVAFRTTPRVNKLSVLEGWLSERFRRHRGNADVLRQELASEHGIRVSLRTVERAVAHLRRELLAEGLATMRFETPPGQQLQTDFGARQIRIGEDSVRAYCSWPRWATRDGSTPGPSSIGPQPADARLASGQYRHRGVVTVQPIGRHHVLADERHQRRQCCGAGVNPAAQG